MTELVVSHAFLFLAGASAGLALGWHLGNRFAWKAVEAEVDADEEESVARLCVVLHCTPDELGALIAEACHRLDRRQEVN